MIPPYQRAYAWKSEDIDDFVKDVKSLVDRRTHGDSYQHFFGGIVSVHSLIPGSSEGREYLVIDGQQRLATFSMILALIVRQLETISEQTTEEAIKQQVSAHAKNIKSDYLVHQSVNDQGQEENRPRLVLSKVDKGFFSDLLWNPQQLTPDRGRESHKLLKEAWEKLREDLIRNHPEDETSLVESTQSLLHLKEAITDGCYVIHIVSTNRSEGYRLFMTLNDRGATLSAGDLLKSHTLELLEGHAERQRNAEANWREILKGGYRKVDAFLRAYLPSQKGLRAGRLTLYDDFCNAFFNFDGTITQEDSQKISREINELVHETRTYNSVVKGDWPYEGTATPMWYRNRLCRLSGTKLLKHALCYPLLLGVKHGLSEEHFAEVVQMLELFIFRYVSICKVHPGRLAETYYRHCRAIREHGENYPVDSLRNDLRELMAEDASDSFFRTSLAEMLVYSKSRSPKILHFLSTIEDYRRWYDNGCQGRPRPNTTRVFDISSLQVEHIYPQNATMVNDELELLIHDLGNLSFWNGDDNIAASNAEFSQKKPIYDRSGISLNRDLANLDAWNLQELEDRRNKLVDMAVKIFTI